MSGQVGEVKEGDLFRVETIDWTAGQIKDNDSAEDMQKVDLSQVMTQLMTSLAPVCLDCWSCQCIHRQDVMVCAVLRAQLLICIHFQAQIGNNCLLCEQGSVCRAE